MKLTHDSFRGWVHAGYGLDLNSSPRLGARQKQWWLLKAIFKSAYKVFVKIL